MKHVKEAILETWLVFSTALWVIVAMSLWLLPKAVWDWFYLIPIFMGTSFNLILVLNIYLNRIYKLNNL